MSYLKKFTIAMALVAAPIVASATTFPTGTYSASDIVDWGSEGGNRSIWGLNIVDGNGASDFWTADSATVVLNNTTATFDGFFTNGLHNDRDENLKIKVHLEFSGPAANGGGFCQFAGSDPGCDNGTNYGALGVNPLDWRYYSLNENDSFIMGNSAAMDGLMWDIEDKMKNGAPPHPPQFGLGANALENDQDGWSMWFIANGLTGSDPIGNDGYTFNSSDNHADFNMRLAPVPVPAAGLLLLGALGMGAMVGRRRKT